MIAVPTVIWDWNGTLLDDLKCSIEAMNEQLGKRRMALLSGVDDYHRRFGFPVIQYYRNVGFDLDQIDFGLIAKEFLRIYERRCHSCSLHEGAVETMRKLRGMGWRQVLISASQQNHLSRQVGRYPIAPYLDGILGMEDIFGASKNHLVARWLKETDTDPTAVWMIGDTDHDYQVAMNNGCRCVLFTGGHQDAESLRTIGVPTIAALSQLPAVLEEVGQEEENHALL